MNKILLSFLSILLIGSSSLYAQNRFTEDELNERLERFLQRFPQADLNKDGNLTMDEFRAFRQKTRDTTPERNRGLAKPTVPDVAYGEHEKQRFDLWPVPNAKSPTPLAIYIHGGGFRSGDKSKVAQSTVKQFHDAGIAFASMNYRLSDVGPYPIMMQDAARGLQTIRARAKEWNIDPTKVACYGGSAGAGITLWLAFHDDLADPHSDDPIARQSTRITAAGTLNGQSTYDPQTYEEWFGTSVEMHPALPPFYGVKKESDWQTPKVQQRVKDASAINHLTSDDQVPVYMTYGRENTPVDSSTSPNVWVHHVVLGLKLKEAMEKLGLSCIVRGPDVIPENDPYGSLEKFLIANLKK
ncbi:Carboxylesterase NlhH [Planctomycetales bacterium 10988]|nr:Carboxylesterase NlhH [Planctomycetales bacterium 10988]